MKSITPLLVSAFISKRLKRKLKRDFCGRPFRIFRERDLHACTYYHLRTFLKGDKNWAILNEPLLRGLKGRDKSALPDIELLHNGELVYLIELKFPRRRTGVQRKDQRVLAKAVKHRKWAKKAYFIETILKPDESRRRVVPYRNKIITIQMREDRLTEYRALYRKRRKPKPRIRKRKPSHN